MLSPFAMSCSVAMKLPQCTSSTEKSTLSSRCPLKGRACFAKHSTAKMTWWRMCLFSEACSSLAFIKWVSILSLRITVISQEEVSPLSCSGMHYRTIMTPIFTKCFGIWALVWGQNQDTWSIATTQPITPTRLLRKKDAISADATREENAVWQPGILFHPPQLEWEIPCFSHLFHRMRVKTVCRGRFWMEGKVLLLSVRREFIDQCRQPVPWATCSLYKCS